MHYNSFSTSLSGPYFGFSWRGPDCSFRRVYAVPGGQDGTKSSYQVLVERSAHNLNVEAGYSYRAPLKSFPLRIQIGITGPIYRGVKTPDDARELRYYSYAIPLEVRLSIKLSSITLIRRRHPLEARERR